MSQCQADGWKDGEGGNREGTYGNSRRAVRKVYGKEPCSCKGGLTTHCGHPWVQPLPHASAGSWTRQGEGPRLLPTAKPHPVPLNPSCKGIWEMPGRPLAGRRRVTWVQSGRALTQLPGTPGTAPREKPLASLKHLLQRPAPKKIGRAHV